MRGMRVVGVVMALGLGVLAPPSTGAADADPPAAPEAVDDVVVMTPTMRLDADVLANDAGGDPVGADLQVCRFDPVDAGLDLHIASHSGIPGWDVIRPGSTYLGIDPTRPVEAGDHLVEYAACDRHHLAWATLTVSVRRVGSPRLPDAPTRIRFTNPLDRDIKVDWWHGTDRYHFRELTLRAGRSREVEVGPEVTRWEAFEYSGGDDLWILDEGRVRGLSDAPRPERQAASSHAAERDEPVDTSPPATNPDHVVFEYTDAANVAVLGNDVDDHPGDLAICRFEIPTDVGFMGHVVPTWETKDPTREPRLAIDAHRVKGGTYEIDYWACDREHLTPGTLTVTVRKFPPPRFQRVEGRPGLLRVHNRGYRTIQIGYDRAGHLGERFRLRVPPHGWGSIRVPFDAIQYDVSTRIGFLSQGTIRHLQQG